MCITYSVNVWFMWIVAISLQHQIKQKGFVSYYVV